MAIINLKKREVECKIVYYGPGRCGKTTNLEYVFRNSRRLMTDEMVSIKTKGDLTIFFDFAPMDAGQIKGCNVRFQLYTVPGQVKYNSTRKLVLKGADGIIFVADSLKIRHQKKLIIVSSDREIRAAAASRKAVSVKSDYFWQDVKNRLETYQKPAYEPKAKRGGITKAETDQWLDFFGIDED